MKQRDKLINNTVETTLVSNFSLYKAFDELGINYDKTKVRDKYVYEICQKITILSLENKQQLMMEF